MNPHMKLLVAAFLVSSAILAGEGSATFTKPPLATRVGSKVRIEFSVQRETDVTVAILDAKGKVVCHLVSGMLGSNAPAPLKSDSLSQAIEWDGRDDRGQPAQNGPFKVRISAGLTPVLEKYLFDDPGAVDDTFATEAMGMDRDGTLYHATAVEHLANWYSPCALTRAYDRNGKYLKTVSPLSSNLSLERTKGTGAFIENGVLFPVWNGIRSIRMYPGREISYQQLAVTSENQIYRLVYHNQERKPPQLRLRVTDTDGGVPVGKDNLSPQLFETGIGVAGQAWLVPSSDEKHLYLSGFENGKKRLHAIYRVSLERTGPSMTFVGNPDEAGSGESRLSAPAGIATDGKGLLYVADSGNGRVAIFKESDGSFVRAIPVASPSSVQVHPNGNVYVLSHNKTLDLIKFSGSDTPKELARLVIGSVPPREPCLMALDGSAEPPVVWFAGKPKKLLGLWRTEDLSAKFGNPVKVNSKNFNAGQCGDLTVDRERNELYFEPHHGTWARLNLSTGALKELPPTGRGAAEATTWCLSPDGNEIYTFGYYFGLRRWDREFQPLAFSPKDKRGLLNEMTKRGADNTPVPLITPPMTYSTRGLGVAPDGDIHLVPQTKSLGRGDRVPSEVLVFGPDGTHKTSSLWRCSPGLVGPRFDAKGNLYVIECVKTPGKVVPDFFKDRLPPLGRDSGDPRRDAPEASTASTAWMSSSILKFSPAGGVIWWVNDLEAGKSGWGRSEVPEAVRRLPKVKLSCLDQEGKLADVEVQGSLWHYYGVSPVGDKLPYGCNCEAARFDVDEFGRSYFPDVLRFRIGILDTNGNEIAFSGKYGNRDEGAKQPAFAYPYQVAVTRTHILVGDLLNRRIAVLKLTYAAETSLSIEPAK